MMPGRADRRTRTWYWALAVWLTTIGCGGSSARVTGKVTHHGRPVGDAEVTVESAAHPGEQYFGLTTADGTIHFSYRNQSGVPPGPSTVRVLHVTLTDGRPLPTGEEGQVLREARGAIGRVYVFEVDLAGGTNALELQLENAAGVHEVNPAEF